MAPFMAREIYKGHSLVEYYTWRCKKMWDQIIAFLTNPWLWGVIVVLAVFSYGTIKGTALRKLPL
ncbi:unnamed protein product, partial [marine sediment metagenome]